MRPTRETAAYPSRGTGSTTPALYAIGGLCVLCAVLFLTARPHELKSRDFQTRA